MEKYLKCKSTSDIESERNGAKSKTTTHILGLGPMHKAHAFCTTTVTCTVQLHVTLKHLN